MSTSLTAERIQVEVSVAMSIREQYGTNQPDKTYEDGIADALLWVLGGKEPQNHAEPLNTAAACSGCGKTQGGQCPDCGPAIGNASYVLMFDPAVVGSDH